MNSIAPRSHLRLRKASAWVLGAVISMAAVTAIAVEDQTQNLPTQAECNAFKAATEAAMKNQLMIVNSFMSSANSTMQSAVSKKNSCIGALAILDFDLSKLVPDFGLLGMLLNTAINRIVTGVINRACAALTDVMNKPSEIWNSIIGGININDQFQNWASGINYGLPGGVGSSGGGNWAGAQPGAVVDPWAGATAPGSTGNSVCTFGPNGMNCTVPGVGQPPPTVSGADIGANFQLLLIACTGALSDDAAGGGGASAASQQACSRVQNYIDTYAPYLDRATIPSLPSYPITIPPNTGSAVGSAASGGPITYSGVQGSPTTPATGSGATAVFGGTSPTNPGSAAFVNGSAPYAPAGTNGMPAGSGITKSDSVFNIPVRK